MAHEINFNAITGKHSFYARSEKAWHGLGQVMDGYQNSQEVIINAGLDYTVAKEPNVHIIPGKGSVTSEDSFFTYRTDTGDVLGSRIGKKYTVLQNVDAFGFFDAITEGEGILYETAGALGDGERIFITAKLPDYIKIAQDDLIEKYLFLYNSHDGTVALR
jgi:phage/plasmid-like protein (TIGR03299 family)